MNFINRAMKNVTRNVTKSILLAITFFVIGNLVIIGLGISSASENAKVLTRKQMRAVISYEIDYDKFWQYADSLESEEERNEAYKNYPTLTPETIEMLYKDERVKAANFFSGWVQFYGNGIDYVKNPFSTENENSFGMEVLEDGTEIPYLPPSFRIEANTYPGQIEIAEGTYEVVEGRYYNQSDIDNESRVCLITDELAEANGLRVGDTISLLESSPSEIKRNLLEIYPDKTIDDFALTMEVIGIYHNNQQLDPSDPYIQYRQPYELPANIILMPASSYKDYSYNIYLNQVEYYKTQGWWDDSNVIPSKEEYDMGSNAVFLLNDPLDVEDYVNDYSDRVSDFTKLNANNETFKKLARPLDTLSFFANIIVLIVVFNAIVIISLITALTLKNRSYEIGVLLSIGVSKVKIVLQLFLELAVVALLGFTLAVASGSLIAGKVGEIVLEYQSNTEEQYATEEDNYGYYSYNDNYFTDISQDDLYSQYEVTIGPVIIAEIYVLGMAVTFISIVIPSVMIMRYNPKQILMNTN